MVQDWQTVKVFISSTFRDMQAERDHLVRFVFPRLREELLKRRIHLVEVDLRWGVTSEQDALGVCQEIIDECRPRFICILGGRYGWTPPGREESITAQEIRYAVLHRPEVKEYRFFYFRDHQVTAAIPEPAARTGGYREFLTPEEMSEFAPEEAERRARRRAQKLEALKQEVMDVGYVPFIYPARWDEAQQRLADLKAFGDRVYEDLLWSINDELGVEAPPELDEFAGENAAMEAFVQERSAGYVAGSRQGLLEELTAFAAGQGPPNVLVVTGPPGSGKSALLARFYLDYSGSSDRPVHAQDLVIPHFIGASPGSTDLRRTLQRFCHELAQAVGLQEEIPQDLQELLRKFPDLLKQAAASRRVVLLIDALNQMDAAGNAHAMYWLPYGLPANVRIVVSSLEHPALEALRRRGKERVREEKLKALGIEDRRAIITGFLNRYRKRMTGEQITALLGKAESGNPLYLLTALEELRTLGTYEEITLRIEELPDQVPDLFRWIFQRLEQDPGFQDRQGRRIGEELVRGFASLLAVSRYGLSQMELAELLAPGDLEAIPPIPPDPQGNVAALLRLLWPYLMQRGELFDFYHGQLRQATESKYLSQEKDRLASHGQMADFFKRKSDPYGDLTWIGDSARGLSEISYHQAHAGKWREFSETLNSFLFLKAKLMALGIFILLEDYNLAAIPALLSNEERREEEVRVLNLIQGALRLSAHVLSQDQAQAQLASQMTGRLLAFGQPGIIALLDEVRKKETRPWLRPLTPSLAAPGGPLLRTLTGHSGDVSTIDVTTDGRLVVSGSEDFTLKVWDLITGELRHTLTGHTDKITGVAVTADGSIAVSGSGDGTLKVWDLATGEVIQSFNDPMITAVDVTPDGQIALSGSSYGEVIVWDIVAGQQYKTLHVHDHLYPVTAVKVTADGLLAVCASIDSVLRVWNIETGNVLITLTGKRGWLLDFRSMSITMNGSLAVSGSNDGTIDVWDLKARGNECLFACHGHWVTDVIVSPDSCLALSGSWDNILTVWDLNTVEATYTLNANKHEVDKVGGFKAMAVTPDGRMGVSGHCDGTLNVWDLNTGKVRHTFTMHKHRVEAVGLTPDGRLSVSGSTDGELKVLDLHTGEVRYTLTGHNGICDMALTPNGRLVVCCFREGNLKVWDLTTGEVSHTLTGHTNKVSTVVVTPEGDRAISASWDQTLRIWDLERGTELAQLIGHKDRVMTVAVTPGGRSAISGSADGTLIVWDLATGEARYNILGHEGPVLRLVVTFDGQLAISSSMDSVLKLWDLRMGREVGGVNLGSPCIRFAVTPSGYIIVAGDMRGSLHFLKLEGEKPGSAIITPWRSKGAIVLALGCPHCRKWSEILESALGTELPCPQCGQPLKLNPFTLNADWRPVARAWRGERD